MSKRRDAVIYARVNVKELAALVRYYDMLGQRPRSKSDMLDLIVSHHHVVLEKYGTPPLIPVTSESEATAILENYGMTWEKGTRGANQLLSSLQQEAMEKDGFLLPGQASQRHTLSSLEEEARRIAAQFRDEDDED